MNSVRWTRAAYRSLAEIWAAAESLTRTQITEQIDSLELRLKRDPTRIGESREAGKRIVVLNNVVVHFRVMEADRLVIVTKVRVNRGSRGR